MLCLQTRLRAPFTAFSPHPALLPFDVPPVRLHESALFGTKIRQNLLPSEFANTPWLVWVAAVILIGKLVGGSQLISMPVFSFGYMAGVFGILSNKKLARRLSYGPPTSRQNKMTLASIIFMFVVMVLVGGPHFGDGNYRLVWLGAFLAIGLHFVPMAWVHGRSMFLLAVLLTANALTGMWNGDISFEVIVYIDVAIKLLWGIGLLLTGKPAGVSPGLTQGH